MLNDESSPQSADVEVAVRLLRARGQSCTWSGALLPRARRQRHVHLGMQTGWRESAGQPSAYQHLRPREHGGRRRVRRAGPSPVHPAGAVEHLLPDWLQRRCQVRVVVRSLLAPAVQGPAHCCGAQVEQHL